MKLQKVIEISARILMGVPVFFTSFAMFIVKAITFDAELTLNDLFLFVCINGIIFSGYFTIIYINRSNILIQILYLIPYAFLARLNFFQLERVFQRLNHGIYNLSYNDKILAFDATTFMIFFIVNIIFIILEKTKRTLFDELENKLHFKI